MSLLLLALTLSLPNQAALDGWFEFQPEPDTRAPFAVVGWASGECGPAHVTVLIDDEAIFQGPTVFDFPGVQERFPGIEAASRAGFWVSVDPADLEPGLHRLEVVARAEACGLERSLGTRRFLARPPTKPWIAWPALGLMLLAVPWWLSGRLQRLTALPPAATASQPILAADRRWLILLLGLYLLQVAVIVAAPHFGTVVEVEDGLFSPLANWDGRHYRTLAREGYDPQEMAGYAFLPTYPTVLKTLDFLPGPLALKASLFNLACFLLAGILAARLLPESRRTWLLMASLPFGFFFFAAYSESLFVLLLVAFLAALYHGRPGLGFAAGIALGLTRITALAACCFALDLARQRRWRAAAAALLGPLTGLAAWYLVVWHQSGDPLALAKAQEALGHSASFEPGRLLDLLLRSGRWLGGMIPWELGSLALVLTGAAWLIRRGWPGAGLYSAAVVLLPLASTRLASLNRFALLALPVFVLLAPRIPRRAFPLLLAVSQLILLYFAWRFGQQHWVG